MMMFQQHMTNPQPQHPGGGAVFREFCRMNPPELMGEYDRSKARE
jgi:hypothetical protein